MRQRYPRAMATPSPTPPRIAPGGRKEIGIPLWSFMRLATKRTGGPVPNVMLTIAKNRGLFLPWLWFASRLMPFGKLPAAESELVILRVAARCGSDYERVHHTSLGAAAGLSQAMIEWSAEAATGDVQLPPAGGKLSPERAALLVRATDELLDTRTLSDATFAELAAAHSDERKQLEFCFLVGQYAMLAGVLNVAGTPIEDGAGMHRLRG